MGVLWQRVPHGDKHRDKREPIQRIVVHSMAEYLYHDGQWMHASDFLNTIGLSAHALVTPDGTIIRQREDQEFAYHAKGHNADSLGVEVLVEGQFDYDSWEKRIKRPYVTEPQWSALVALCRQWVDMWAIREIVRHSDIDPTRKPDPGEGFDWDRFLQLAEYRHGTI